MPVLIDSTDIGSAWLAAYQALQKTGHAVNLAVSIADPLREDRGVRRAIEQQLVDLRTNGKNSFGRPQSMHTVANTIFPISLYRPGSDGAAQRFLVNVAYGESQRAGDRNRGWGTYIGRLTAYPAPDGTTTNQIQSILDNLSAAREYKDRYEIPIAAPHIDVSQERDCAAGAVLHGDSSVDVFRAQGGPCLAHVSLTSFEGSLSMVALYRAHVYETRAYGNFLGLARLLAFFANESGREVGELLFVTGHAWANAPGRDRILAAARAASGQVVDIETHARPLGSSMRDLDLPQAAQ
jgi:thymidylate synthase